ncbi:hypothetical protein KCP76_11500 [Salmonella enterica subsp. enterica serovar Weltevreden]|nr:hypothetical protein KCP76_11500 [Salmonella enterica subsp. enterica serovar Weltevreden]
MNIVSHFARADEPECVYRTSARHFNTFCGVKTRSALYCRVWRYSAVAVGLTLTGRVRASFCMAYRRWSTNHGGRILVFSR